MDAHGPLERVLALEGAGTEEAAAYASALRTLAAALRDPSTAGEIQRRMTAWLLPALGLDPRASRVDDPWREAMWDAAADALSDANGLAGFFEKAAGALRGRRPAHLNLLALLRTRVGWRAKDKLRRRTRYRQRFGGRILPGGPQGTVDERGRKVAALVVERLEAEFEGVPHAREVVSGLLEGQTVSEVSRSVGISRQRIYRLMERMRHWIEGAS